MATKLVVCEVVTFAEGLGFGCLLGDEVGGIGLLCCGGDNSDIRRHAAGFETLWMLMGITRWGIIEFVRVKRDGYLYMNGLEISGPLRLGLFAAALVDSQTYVVTSCTNELCTDGSRQRSD